MRASRLLSILLHLQSHGRSSARELAEASGVSIRTIYRDIDALSEAGVPVYGEPGPAGGYALVDGYRTRLTGLTPAEAGALFLSGIPGPAAELGLGALLEAAELKVLAALPPGLRESATLSRERFLLDAPGWFHEADRPLHLPVVAAAVWEGRALRIWYRGRTGDGPRDVQPLGLVLKGGAWYLVAAAGTEARTYRLSRIVEIELRHETFERPEGFDLASYWRASSEAFLAVMYSGRATVRLSARGLQLLPHLVDPWVARFTAESAAEAGPDGWTDAVIPIESEEIAVDQILRLGAEVEVVAPQGLRRRIAAAADGLARLYGEAKTTPATGPPDRTGDNGTI